MARAVLVVLVSLLVVAGCGQANSPVEKREKKEGVEKAKEEVARPNLPAYDVTLEQDCPQGNFSGKCYSVSTDATSEKDLRALTEYFRDENPQSAAVLVTFYPKKPTADQSGSGFAFENATVARVVLSQMYQNPEDASVDEEVRKAMENNGIWVMSIADEVESMTQDMCNDWDTTTMGTPPPEWNCPGY
jgi:hypothetical protein